MLGRVSLTQVFFKIYPTDKTILKIKKSWFQQNSLIFSVFFLYFWTNYSGNQVGSRGCCNAGKNKVHNPTHNEHLVRRWKYTSIHFGCQVVGLWFPQVSVNYVSDQCKLEVVIQSVVASIQLVSEVPVVVSSFPELQIQAIVFMSAVLCACHLSVGPTLN